MINTVRLFLLMFLLSLNVKAQWHVMPTGISTAVYDVDFFTDSIGLICGTGGIRKTINQGDSWNIIPSSGCYKLDFVSENVGFSIMSNDDVLRTLDQGESWSVIGSFPNLQLNNIQFLNADTGFIVGHVAGPLESYVLSTVNGGASWSIDSFPGVVTLQDVHFVDENTGYAAGINGQLYKTSNGGENWTLNQLIPFETIIALDFFDSQLGLAVGYSDFLGQDVNRTLDGGQNWVPINTSSTSGTVLRGVDFVDNNTVFAVGDEGRIIVSYDGGAIWSMLDAGVTSDLNDVHFLNESLGFAVGSGGVVLRFGNPPPPVGLVDNTVAKTRHRFYPNPLALGSTGHITNHEKLAVITITDQLGKQIVLSKSESQENLSSFFKTQGVYHIQFMNKLGQIQYQNVVVI